MSENIDSYGDLIIENRKKASLTGVSDVESFDEETIVAKSACGDITIKGSGMKINRLSVETGDMTVEGHIDSVAYGAEKTKGSLLERLFK
ncbi:MAG: sporulation protein YabP [Ruminococcus sp.]|nr:sporulation protein YabP [Candidatus Copronaster equi]